MVTKPSGRGELKMHTFAVRVLVVPPIYKALLTGDKPRYEVREIEGYTLADAKRRAGIK